MLIMMMTKAIDDFSQCDDDNSYKECDDIKVIRNVLMTTVTKNS